MIRVFRISQKKWMKMVKLFDFYGILKKDLWGAYEWSWDIVDFLWKVFTVPFKVISKISEIEGDSEYFSQKINDVPRPLISSPQVLFQNTIKIKQFHHFHPFFLRNSKNPNHRLVDLTLAHKMNIRFTKISQSPSGTSVGVWNTI